MFSSSRKPYTAVTVQIEHLTSSDYEENDLGGIVDLIEVIRIQDSGPTEAARAIRKKLKYGNTHRQLRALTILDGLMQNGGGRFQRTFADEPLLERLRILPRDDLVDQEVKQKCNLLFRQWAVAYRDTRGLEGVANLQKQLPTKSRPSASQSKVLRETEAQANEDPFGDEEPPTPPSPVHARKGSASLFSALQSSPSSSSSSRPRALSSTQSPSNSYRKDKKDKRKRKPFNLEKERGRIMETIASASIASTNLFNALKLIDRENQRPSDDAEAVQRFETCKTLRRQVLRYIQLVESDQLIGTLLTANDELVKALMSFEIADKSIEDDSDSETEALTTAGIGSSNRKNSIVDRQLAGLSLSETPPPKPPRPASGSVSRAAPTPMARIESSESESEDEEDDDDEDNPFGDRNAINN